MATRPGAVSGQGGHDVTFGVACALVWGFGLSPEEAMPIMQQYNGRCSPPWSERELWHKLRSALGHGHKEARGHLIGENRGGGEKGALNGVAPEPRYREAWRLPFDLERLREAVKDAPAVDVGWFARMSPVDVKAVDAAGYLERVFREGEKVLVFDKFRSQGQFIQWVGKGGFRLGARPDVRAVPSKLPVGGPDGIWYLANPVDGLWHPNPRELDELGRPAMSRRSQESVVCQRHVVFECDHKERACDCEGCGGKDHPGVVGLWMRFLALLPLPVVAVYTSGGKSLHALCRVDFESKGQLDAFKRRHGGMFSKLGADPRAWSPTQLTRLPCCKRGNRMQELLYLNPNPDPHGVPIAKGGNVCVE